VDELGEGLLITGYSTLDELPEAIELPGKRFVLGVQWHPEADEKSRVVGALVEEARSAALAAD
jgi:putative glutamine amidotransferase